MISDTRPVETPSQPPASGGGEDTSAPPHLGRFFLNLSLVIAVGVATLYWIGHHTELLGVVGGLLGLGGVAAWVAFVLGVIRDERVGQLQRWLDDHLTRGRTTVVMVVAAILLVLVGGLFGSIRIDARRADRARFVTVSTEDAGAVPAGETLTVPVFVGWRHRSVVVAPEGLPAASVVAAPYHRRVVAMPTAFLTRHVVLFRPTTEISQTISRSGSRFGLRVVVDGDTEHELESYGGETVWIGCDAFVDIPDRLRDRWRLELLARGIPEAASLPWFPPSALAADQRLEPGTRLEFFVIRPDGTPWPPATAVVEPCRSPECFAQEVVFDAS